MNKIDFIRENNRIENIHRDPLPAEIDEYDRFITLDEVTVTELERFVSVYQPGAVLRREIGLDVRVGRHMPPPGGHDIEVQLTSLLDNIDRMKPWVAHVRYETIHPFTDCNGRSGRMLWAWTMLGHPFMDLGFLHAFYYQSLDTQRI